MGEERIVERIIKRVREEIRRRTPGEVPVMRNEHPVIGLVHDIQRLVRRRVRKFLYRR